MSFDWELYIQLAGELISHQRIPSIQEAYLRSAISRSYYGVYGIASNLLIRKGITFPPNNIHKFVRYRYQNSLDRTEKAIGDKLHRLLRERIDADYKDDATIDIKRTQTAHQLAIRTLNELKSIGAV